MPTPQSPSQTAKVRHLTNHLISSTLLVLSLVEATFSMPITGSAAEEDTPFMACVMLTTEAGVTLDMNITVEINTTDGTGEV